MILGHVLQAKCLVVGDVIKFSLQCAVLCGVLVCVTRHAISVWQF